MKRIALCMLAAFAVNSSFAGTICPSKAVTGVQLKKNGDVIYMVLGDDGTSIHRSAGNISTPVGAKSFDLLSSLVNSNVLIQAGYPDGYNCDKPSQNMAPDWLFAENQIQREN